MYRSRSGFQALSIRIVRIIAEIFACKDLCHEYNLLPSSLFAELDAVLLDAAPITEQDARTHFGSQE